VSEKEIANVADVVLLLVALREGILFSKAVRKRNISCYTADVMLFDFNGQECKIRHYKRLQISSKFILDKKMNISAFFMVTDCRIFHCHYQQ
jgi:hypothetical protein